MLRVWECKKCKRKMLDCDLKRTKCSENSCGSYMLSFCPYCMDKGHYGEVEVINRFCKMIGDDGI